MNNAKTIYKKYKNYMYYSLIILLLLSTVTYAATSDQAADPFDFNEKVEASTLRLAAGGTKSSADQSDTSSDRDEEASPQKEEPSNTDTPIETESPSDRQKPSSEKPAADNMPGTSSDAKPSPDKPKPDAQKDIEIVEVADQQNRYFTTNITHNETVTEPLYSVTINHLDESLTVEETNVTLNGKRMSDFKGDITLAEGANTIEFRITYKQSDKKQLRVSQAYTVTLNSDDVVITTELKDQTVIDETLTFTARATLGDKPVKLQVFIHKQELKPLAGNTYKAQLVEGENTIKLIAQHSGKQAAQQYTVNYEKENSTIALETDLKDQRANSEEFSFYAQASAGEVDVPLKITVNDQTVSPSDGMNYAVQLINGTNIIELTGQYKDERIERQYTISFKDPNVNEKPQTDPDAPKLVTDLKPNSTVKGDIKTINVWPVTASGERIRGKNVLVQVNGQGVPFTWDDSAKTSYKLTLQTGQNNISIKIWDDEGRTLTENFTITSVAPEEDGIIGQVTISLEASVLGIPYLIKPTKMDIHQGERGSYILDQFLRNHGFDYGKTGNLDRNFYLRDVSKPGMLDNVAIPDDLWELVVKYSTTANRDAYSPDSLSEFDFANGSGWMYNVNGDFPNYGFSDAYFLDGDVVRVRYTLNFGNDIKGNEGAGGDTGDNWVQER